ncbi:MAG: hypothetical protein Q9219_007607 [cf. Caloplaca sp. 3 TL-2023]
MGNPGLGGNPRGAFVVYFSIALGVLDTVAVILRLVARSWSKAVFAADDWWIIGSLFPFYCMVALEALLTILGGMGRSINDLSPHQINVFLKTLMCSLIAYSLSISSVRISLLILYRRIFNTAAFKTRSLIVGVACVIWLIIELFLTIFQCHPVKAAFDPASQFSDRCINPQHFYLGVLFSSLALDLIILLLPLNMVWRLQLPLKQRFALSGIFSIGIVVCIASSMRITSVFDLSEKDITKSMADAALWSHIEPAVAIFCACVITYRPLFADFNVQVPKRLSSVLDYFKQSRKTTSDGDDYSSDQGLRSQSSKKAGRPTTHGLRPSLAYHKIQSKSSKQNVQVVVAQQEHFGLTTVCRAGSSTPQLPWPSGVDQK